MSEHSDDERDGRMYACIECAHPVQSLYTWYGPHNVRLTQCPNCKSFADKYVEYDAVIIVIDLILIKPQVYRHLLFNRLAGKDDRIDPTMVRLGLMLTLFDVYLTWARVEKQAAMEQVPFAGSSVFEQYLFFLVLCIAETLALHLVVRLLARWWLGWQRPNALSTAVLISSSVKLFPILMVIWAYDIPAASRAVGWAVIVNNIEALRILLDCVYWKAACLALLGALGQNITGKIILQSGLGQTMADLDLLQKYMTHLA